MIFYYTARSGDGASVSGSLEAQNRSAALSQLRMRKLWITFIGSGGSARGALQWLKLTLGRSGSERSSLFRCLATLLASGVSLRAALEVIGSQTRDASLGEALRSVAAQVDAGTALSHAARCHPDHFSPVILAMIQAGEIAGALDDALASIAELEERNRALRKRIAAALLYPGVVCGAATALTLFLLGNTIPSFARVFAEMHVTLPPTTRALIAIGYLVNDPRAVPAAIVLAVAAAAVAAAYRRSAGRWAELVDRLRLALPAIGPIVREAMVVRFARTLGTLLRAGVDVLSALETSMGSLESPVFSGRVRSCIEAVRSGEPLASALETRGVLNGIVLQLVRTGETSGTLDAMLLRGAAYCEVDLEARISALTSILEPALICALGAVVALIVSAILIPLYSMIGDIK